MTKKAKSGGRLLGFLLAAAGAAAYGLNPIFAVPLYRDGMNADSVLLFRYIFAVAMVAVMLVARGRSFRVSWPQAGTMTVLGVLMALSSLALFLSYEYMNAGIASTLLFIYPLMVAVIMMLFFREHINLWTAVALILALGGVALLCRNSSGEAVSFVGTMLVMASSLSYAIYIVGVNHSNVSEVATLKITFYILVFGSLVFIIRLLSSVELTVPCHWYHWLNLIGLALFPTAVSFLCTTQAIHYIGATPTAILGALEPVTALVLGIIILRQPVTPRQWLGTLLILLGVTVVVSSGKLPLLLTRLRHLFPSLRRKSIKE